MTPATVTPIKHNGEVKLGLETVPSSSPSARLRSVACGLAVAIGISLPVTIPLAMIHREIKEHKALPISSVSTLSNLEHGFLKPAIFRLESESLLTLLEEKKVGGYSSYNVPLKRYVGVPERTEYSFEFQTKDGKTHSIFAGSTDLRKANIQDYVLISNRTKEDGGLNFYLSKIRE